MSLINNNSVHDAKTVVIAFPYAGGNKYAYRFFENLLPRKFNWETFEIPGRGQRINEPLLSSTKEIIDDLFPKILETICDANYIIYGHSMGALVGLLLAKRLLHSAAQPPLALFVTGRGGPTKEKNIKISDFDRNNFWKEIEGLGGLPDAIFSNKDFLDYLEPIMRADCRVIEDFEYHAELPLLNCPIYAFVGDQEGVSDEELLSWKDETNETFVSKKIPGDHFFIFDHSDFIIKQMVSEIECSKSTITNNKKIIKP